MFCHNFHSLLEGDEMATAQAMREQEKTVSVSLSYKEKLCLHFVMLLWKLSTEILRYCDRERLKPTSYSKWWLTCNKRMLANKRKKLMIEKYFAILFLVVKYFSFSTSDRATISFVCEEASCSCGKYRGSEHQRFLIWFLKFWFLNHEIFTFVFRFRV